MKHWHPLFLRARAASLGFRRGSVLLITIFIVTGLILIVGSLMQAGLNETKMNQRGILTMEAKDAAESATEYIISQVKWRMDNYPQLPASYFTASELTIPSNISTWLWSGTDVNPANVTVSIGLVPSTSVIYVDPTNPANTFDPDRGKNLTACDVYVFATAKANNQWGSEAAYASQAVEVRNSPLFTNAIFYNMDLEFSPGPAMSINGPVHANGDIWATAGTSLTFSGPVTVSGNFDVGFKPWPTDWSSSNAADVGSLVYLPNTAGGYTTPYKGTGSTDLSSSYWDSRQTNYSGTVYTNWREQSANLWGGNLQTSVNGVPDEQVTGYNDFAFEVNGSGAGTGQDMNYAYAMVEPNQTNPATNVFHKGAGENPKFERQAGLIIKVLNSGVANITMTSTLPGNYTGGGAANTTVINTNTGLNSAALNSTVSTWQSSGTLSLPGSSNASGTAVLPNGSAQSFSGASQFNGNITQPATNTTAILVLTQTQQFSNTTVAPGNETTLMEVTNASYSGGNTTFKNTRYVGYAWVEFDTVAMSVNATTNTLQPNYDTTTQLTDSYGDITYPGDVTEVPLTVNPTMITGGAGDLTNLIKFRPAIGNMTAQQSSGNLSGNTSDVWNGLYDGRRGKMVSTLDLDVGKLKNIVDNNVASYPTDSSGFFNGVGSAAYNPGNQYNGILYVEFPSLPGNTTRTNPVVSGNVTYPGDKIIDSVDGYGLMVYNGTSSGSGTVTGVPNPDYTNATYTSIGVAGRTAGFTLATNNCVYVKGSYNADGNLATPLADSTSNVNYNSSMPDFPAHPDPACCMAADSVTILSYNGSSTGWVSRKSSAVNNAVPEEFNAALLTGIVPSLKYNSTTYSGGSHNFPRFLENWSGDAFRYRGSIVALFESEIGTQPYGSSYYSPPNREWGFYNQFKNGVYPPGTPGARSYYRVNFNYYLNVAQYNAAKTAAGAP